MTLYYAKDEDGTDTIRFAGKPLVASDPKVISIVMAWAEEHLDFHADYDICPIEVGVVHEPILRFEEDI